jgi:hypothetical protein
MGPSIRSRCDSPRPADCGSKQAVCGRGYSNVIGFAGRSTLEYIQVNGSICRSLALSAAPRHPQTHDSSSAGASLADRRCTLISA